MPPRLRVFILLAILVFIAHVIVSVYAADHLSKVLDRDAPIESRFAPSFAMAVCALPLLHPTFLNDIVFALLVAAVLTLFHWRTIVSLIILIPLLLLGGMFFTALWLENRVQRGWNELAPQAIIDAPMGDLVSPLGKESFDPVTSYLAKEIARGDDQIDPEPQEVNWFFVANHDDIEKLRERVPGTNDPLALFRMQKILLVDALRNRSWDDVTAARRISDKMLHQSYHQSVLFAMAATENQLGVIRKLNPPLHPTLPSFDPHRQLIDAIAAQEARLMTISPPWYSQPYARLCLAESADSALRQAMLIENLRGCSFDSPADFEFKPRVPFNPTGVLNGGLRYAIRANRLVLDLEGTSYVLAAKHVAPPPSAAKCTSYKWILDRNTLRLDPPLPANAPFLPTRHEISAANPASRSSS